MVYSRSGSLKKVPEPNRSGSSFLKEIIEIPITPNIFSVFFDMFTMNPDYKKSSVQYRYSASDKPNQQPKKRRRTNRRNGTGISERRKGGRRLQGGYTNEWSSWRTSRVRILYEMKSLKTAQWRRNLFLKYRRNGRDIGESRHHLTLYWQERVHVEYEYLHES
jgi:hypothetical protein